MSPFDLQATTDAVLLVRGVRLTEHLTHTGWKILDRVEDRLEEEIGHYFKAPEPALWRHIIVDEPEEWRIEEWVCPLHWLEYERENGSWLDRHDESATLLTFERAIPPEGTCCIVCEGQHQVEDIR